MHDCQFKAYLTKNTNSHKFTDHTNTRHAHRQADRQTRVQRHTWRIRYVNWNVNAVKTLSLSTSLISKTKHLKPAAPKNGPNGPQPQQQNQPQLCVNLQHKLSVCLAVWVQARVSVCVCACMCVCILVHAAGALALHSSVLYLAGSQIKFRDMTLQHTQCVAGVQQQSRQQQQQHGLNMATVSAWMLRPLEMHLALLLV